MRFESGSDGLKRDHFPDVRKMVQSDSAAPNLPPYRSLSPSEGVTVEGTATSTPPPTGLEPVAFPQHRHLGKRRGPGASNITQDNHAA